MGSSTRSDATRARSSVLRVLAAAAVAVAVTACAGDGDDGGSQETPRLVAVRYLPGPPPRFNPPRIDLVTLGEDGSGVEVLVRTPMRGETTLLRVSNPVWSPDGEWIYFRGAVREQTGPRFTFFLADVFAVRADGTGLRRLTETGDAGSPVPSPDGETIAFYRNEHQDRFPPTSGLWLMNADGGEQRRLLPAQEGRLDTPGSWSPDGRTLAFTRCRYAPPGRLGRILNTCTVQTVSSSGSDTRQLAGRARAPVFSPDGERIAFLTDRDEHGLHLVGSDEQAFANELYVMDADGRRPRRLTRTAKLDEEDASWSPDGARIAYGREGPSSFVHQLMIVNADGSCPTRIAGNGFIRDVRETRDYNQPAWRPGDITGDRSELDCSE